ncbi:uncharacterized protein LOC129774868 [Toxorhynchites rutilus septentrionalis]|uniref:uncharacterized protein LOC129774868 n=1 Tax=Toxorhynchites rutilus septentrionalis TaxID=329112 RepID=UPI0024786F29|nr:uncharacterized protein LOC129774868 [Toxorhynchites rutilus septentrionalis]
MMGRVSLRGKFASRRFVGGSVHVASAGIWSVTSSSNIFNSGRIVSAEAIIRSATGAFDRQSSNPPKERSRQRFDVPLSQDQNDEQVLLTSGLAYGSNNFDTEMQIHRRHGRKKSSKA